LIVHPILSKAANTRFALVDGHLLMELQRKDLLFLESFLHFQDHQRGREEQEP
jgi:hypothetical protein